MLRKDVMKNMRDDFTLVMRFLDLDCRAVSKIKDCKLQLWGKWKPSLPTLILILTVPLTTS